MLMTWRWASRGSTTVLPPATPGPVQGGLGLTSSTTKTLLVPTKALDSQTLHDALPQHWRFIKLAASAIYLGTSIGREVTLRDVFANMIAKLQSRVDQ